MHDPDSAACTGATRNSPHAFSPAERLVLGATTGPLGLKVQTADAGATMWVDTTLASALAAAVTQTADRTADAEVAECVSGVAAVTGAAGAAGGAVVISTARIARTARNARIASTGRTAGTADIQYAPMHASRFHQLTVPST